MFLHFKWILLWHYVQYICISDDEYYAQLQFDYNHQVSTLLVAQTITKATDIFKMLSASHIYSHNDIMVKVMKHKMMKCQTFIINLNLHASISSPFYRTVSISIKINFIIYNDKVLNTLAYMHWNKNLIYLKKLKMRAGI